MAVVDYFLKIDGIPGESVDAKHKGEIEVESFSWGVSRTATQGAGGGGGAGKVRFQDLHISKQTDASSPNLFLKCASGAHIKRAVLSARKAGGEQQQDFLKITFSNVLVSSYKLGSVNPGPPTIGAGIAPVDTTNGGIVGPGLPADAVSLNFASLQYLEGAIQHIPVTPSASGQLAFDPKTNTVNFVEGPAGVMTVGSVNGGIQRGVQEFNIAILIGLLTAPFSNAHLTLGVSEIREAAINPGIASLASVNASSTDDDKPKPHLFDVILYTPADGVIDASDLTRPGTRIGTVAVDPNADPASLDIDLTQLVTQRNLGAFGIRVQLRGLQLPDPFEDEDGEGDPDRPTSAGTAKADSDTQSDDKPRAPFSASFSLDLALDTA